MYVVLGFQLMARASTDASLEVGDVTVNQDAVVVHLRKEKGRDAFRDVRPLLLPLPATRGVAAVVAYWLLRRSLAWRSVPADSELRRTPPTGGPSSLARAAPSSLFFALPTDGSRISADPSRWCTAWLQESCSLLGAAPPPGESWQSHSLRSGAASAAAAVGVDLFRIRYYGGWARDSGAVFNYVHPTVQPDDAARVFFGWLTAGGAQPAS